MLALRPLLFAAVGALIVAAPAGADTLPATVRACIGEADAARRLACYDREVARLIAPADTFATAVSMAPAAPAAPIAPAVAAAAAVLPATPAAAPTGSPKHFSAKVSAVRGSDDDLVVTLDNGDVWQQSAPGTSQLNLHPGDVVTVDHELGSWFLSNRYGDNIQVRLRKPQS